MQETVVNLSGLNHISAVYFALIETELIVQK
jgi:hypothetical protein